MFLFIYFNDKKVTVKTFTLIQKKMLFQINAVLLKRQKKNTQIRMISEGSRDTED